MTSPRLEAASKSDRTEAEAREARRVAYEKARADFHRSLRAEQDARQRAAQNGEDY